jgi:Protein of unknown function (DUF3303)
MKFMVSWSVTPEQQKAATARFLETGAQPPNGVTMLGRWHSPGMGFVLAETNDAKALHEWTSRWLDLLKFVVTPVIEDAEAAEVMKKIS